MTTNVLILGSKPPPKIPKIDFQEIFSSNGSAELAKIYNLNFKSIEHTCIIGAKSFSKLNHIKSRVIDAEPDNIVIRDYEKVYSNISNVFKKDLKITKFTKTQQILFQRKFFKNGIINLFFAETNYEKKLLNKIKHILRGFFLNGFMGVSTGFFAILYAAHKYPHSNLILSGLGFEGGEHYYNEGKMTSNRGNVDRYLFKFLNAQVKNRIYIFDNEISKKLNVKNLEAEQIILR